MNNWEAISHNDAIEKWLSFPKVIFFCGAGVSMFAPTGFPTGKQVLQACVHSLQDQFRRAGYPDIQIDEMQNLPLETLVSLFLEGKSAEVESEGRRELAAYFRSGSPNRIHYLIAATILLRSDAHVITTNYDNCIEQAVGVLRHRFSLDRDVRVYGVEQIHDVDFDNGNAIVKIHGCSVLDAPASLVLTTPQEASGFPRSLSVKLERLFQDGLMVFMGHSLSEPDTMEALIAVSDYDAIWFERNWAVLEQNRSAGFILKRARHSYAVKDLVPFIQNSWCNTGHPLSPFEEFTSSIVKIKIPFSEQQDRKQISGIETFEKLTQVTSVKDLFRIAVNGQLQLRSFAKVKRLLDAYPHLAGYSEFDYRYWLASITRDQNDDWAKSRGEFEAARKIKTATPLERSLALLERLGLDTLLCGRNQARLRQIEQQIVKAIDTAKVEASSGKSQLKPMWTGIIGRLQKNLIQNLGRQRFSGAKRYETTLQLADQAISTLNESRSIHARVETERFKARILFRYYLETKNIGRLSDSIELAGRSLRLFELLASNLGVINARREYAMFLIKAGRLTEAESEVEQLYDLTSNSPDHLSYRKTLALHAYLSYQKRKFLGCVRLLLQFLMHSAFDGWLKDAPQNFLGSLSWYRSFLKGNEG